MAARCRTQTGLARAWHDYLPDLIIFHIALPYHLPYLDGFNPPLTAGQQASDARITPSRWASTPCALSLRHVIWSHKQQSIRIVARRTDSVVMWVWIGNWQLPTAHCQLPTANRQPPAANYQLPTANCQLTTAHCQLSSSRR